MESKKYILGCGISALIYSYYHPEYKIISENIGGKLSNSFMKNIVLLHSTPETEDFLTDLGIKFEKKTCIIKYVKNGALTNDIVSVDKLQFIRKKMQDNEFEVKDFNLSTSDYYISLLDVDLDRVIEKLKENTKIIIDRVIRITDKEIITENSRYEYEEIISTLPAPVFWSLYHKINSIKLTYKSVTFLLCDKVPIVLEEAHAKWSMCYFLDDDYKYTRISTRGNLYLYEFTGNVSKEEIVKYLPKDARVKDYYVDEYGIIITNKNNIPPERVRFLGRFSQWEHSIKMQDVIKISKWFYDFNFIWTRQKSFSSKRLDFNLLDNIDEKEKETQLMLLHLLCELSEILGETNYKKHKQKHDINKEKIREEIIDSFKYLLNIALVWDISCEDFVKEFNRKSDIVEDRYKKEMENKK